MMAGSVGFVLAGFDRERDVPFETEWTAAPADVIVLVDGSFTLRPELRDIWSTPIWLGADSETRDEWISEREGITAGSEHARRCSGAHELHLATSPRDSATHTIDNSDPDAPERM